MKDLIRDCIRIIPRRILPPVGRSVSVYPDDVFIVSYPKSGNTWMRFLVANLIWKDRSTNFLNINKRIAPIYAFSDLYLSLLPRPRFLKSHEYFDPRYPKVLYIVRDVRSVFVSYYYHKLRRQEIRSSISCYQFAEIFLRGELDPFGTWRENVLSWISVRGEDPERFYLVRYEDLKKNGMVTLEKVASFLGLEVSTGEPELAFTRSSFSEMRQLEREAGTDWKGGQGVQRKDIPFVRSGKVDEWKEFLDRSTLHRIQERCGNLLKELGYEV